MESTSEEHPLTSLGGISLKATGRNCQESQGETHTIDLLDGDSVMVSKKYCQAHESFLYPHVKFGLRLGGF
jgi:hypothetical protein